MERLLRAPSQMGLYTRVQSLEYLGSMFRGTLNVPARFTDLQVGVNGTLVGLLLTNVATAAQKLLGERLWRAHTLDCRHACSDSTHGCMQDNRRAYHLSLALPHGQRAGAVGLQAGEMLLREHIFIHLDRPIDKLKSLIAMTGKLFALVADLCGEDNADALSHHEALLPGTLLSKFVSDKLAECLIMVKRQVSLLSCITSAALMQCQLSGLYDACKLNSN